MDREIELLPVRREDGVELIPFRGDDPRGEHPGRRTGWRLPEIRAGDRRKFKNRRLPGGREQACDLRQVLLQGQVERGVAVGAADEGVGASGQQEPVNLRVPRQDNPVEQGAVLLIARIGRGPAGQQDLRAIALPALCRPVTRERWQATRLSSATS